MMGQASSLGATAIHGLKRRARGTMDKGGSLGMIQSAIIGQTAKEQKLAKEKEVSPGVLGSRR
jgi:hypothetical protein